MVLNNDKYGLVLNNDKYGLVLNNDKNCIVRDNDKYGMVYGAKYLRAKVPYIPTTSNVCSKDKFVCTQYSTHNHTH